MAQPLNNQTKERPLELRKRLPELYRTAGNRGINLSMLLERDLDPSDDWAGDSWGGELDAFQRVLKTTKVLWKSDPSRGYWADTWGDIVDGSDDGRIENDVVAVIPEWASRVWRAAKRGYMPQVRFLINSGDEAIGTAMRPYADAAAERQVQMRPKIPLSELVAIETPIRQDVYRSVYLNEPTPNDVRFVRIGEGAELPRAKVDVRQHTIDIFKYGRAIEFTYEVLRRQPVDKIGWFIAKAALQAENDKVERAIDVVINGDGNANTAATVYAHSTLDTGTTLTARGWFAFKLKFPDPYTLTHIFGQEGAILNLVTLNTGTANQMLAVMGAGAGFGDLEPIDDRLGSGVRYGHLDIVPTGKYVGIDARYSLERVTEVGAEIQETGAFIERQTRLLTFSEVEGYSVLDPKANAILNLA